MDVAGLANYYRLQRDPSRKLPSDASLPDELNTFYAHFEASNTEACMRAPAVPNDCVITLSVTDVSNIHKAVGPDRLPGCVLRACADNWQVSSLTF